MKTRSWFSGLLGMSSMTLDNLEDVLLHELQDLYSAENQLIDALPEMAEGAHAPELKTALREHLAVTRHQKDRLEEAFRLLGQEPEEKVSEAMQGLIEDGRTIVSLPGDPEVKDAAIISAAQRVEHYEIAGYGSARTFAHRIGRHDVAKVLQSTLDEEGETDKRLTQIAELFINRKAATA